MRSTSSPRAVSMMIGVCDSCAHLAAQAEAVLAGQHDVEDHEIDAMVGHRAHHFAAVGRRRDVAGVGAQIFRDQRPRLAVVFNDENVGRCLGHADLLSVIRGCAKDFCFRMFPGGAGQ